MLTKCIKLLKGIGMWRRRTKAYEVLLCANLVRNVAVDEVDIHMGVVLLANISRHVITPGNHMHGEYR